MCDTRQKLLLHINILEPKAVHKACKHSLSFIQNQSMWMLDNMKTVCYVREGELVLVVHRRVKPLDFVLFSVLFALSMTWLQSIQYALPVFVRCFFENHKLMFHGFDSNFLSFICLWCTWTRNVSVLLQRWLQSGFCSKCFSDSVVKLVYIFIPITTSTEICEK